MQLSGNSQYNIVPIPGFPQEKGRFLNKEAILHWLSTGFFLGRDSFWEDVQWKGFDTDECPWNYNPKEQSLEQAVTSFADLFHAIVEGQTRGKQVILPLSGGLDSRTLAVALSHLGQKPYTYSYRFENSFDETSYGKAIAETLGWSFDAFTIPSGFLWEQIDNAADINRCYAEFTHARQLACIQEISAKGNLWLLGHLGDLIFDDMGVEDDLPINAQLGYLNKKMVKKAGKALATDLHKHWGLEGDYSDVLQDRFKAMLERIPITNANARLRAFKSMYSVTRWTNTNLAYFEHEHPMALPYYDDRMCEFVMNVPEKLLSGRQIQIEYIKKYGAKLAAIPWQSKAPYNLYNYHKHLSWQHLPYRIKSKLKRMFKGEPVQRNWEIQFLGEENDRQLRMHLFDNPKLSELVPPAIVEKYYRKFKDENPLLYSHPVSMLLTLSMFTKKFMD